MKYCPTCENVTDNDELKTCVACGETLLGLDELSEKDAERPVLLTFCQPAEAQVLRTTLENEGIHAMIEDEGLLDLLNPFDVADPEDEGNVRVLVHLKDAETALEILHEKEAGELAIDDDLLDDDFYAKDGEEEEADEDEEEEDWDEEDDEEDDDEDWDDEDWDEDEDDEDWDEEDDDEEDDDDKW